MILWIPVGLFLVSFRLEAGKPFDYRPLLSFLIVLAYSGAGFLSMGLFFSSLTRNQIIAFVLTFLFMIIYLGLYLLVRFLPPGSAWSTFLTHISFLNHWLSAVSGKLVIRDMVFPLSATVFWLFLTVKVLEARKWS
jgi:ABC-2 type transport system permease protein